MWFTESIDLTEKDGVLYIEPQFFARGKHCFLQNYRR